MTRFFARAWWIAAVLAVATTSWSQPTLIHAPDPADPMAVHVYRLKNGLTVYLSENDQKPRFYAEIVVRAGSKHDPAVSTGIAHYLEHMLFKGTTRLGTLDYEAEGVHLDSIVALYEQHFAEIDSTKRRELYALINEQGQLGSRYAVPGELDRIYSALGAEGLNAHTWVEETVYKVDLPSNRLAHWAKLEAERFAQPVFRLFQTELETVYEEKNRSLDNKHRLIRDAVNRHLYKVHPYGQQTTLGSVEHLKNPSLKLMYDYYRTWYVPNNMAVIISGDVDVEQAIELIDREFSGWERRELPKLKKWREKKLKEIERVEVVYPGEEYVLLAFRTAPSTHEHTEALQVLDYILDNATAGLINLNLNQRQRVRRAGSWTTSHHNRNDYGAQYLYGVPKEGQTLEEVEALLVEQLDLIKSGRFEDWIIPAIVTDWKKTYRRRLESNSSRVALMHQAFLSFQEWDHARRKLERMAALRKEDIVKVARKYFGDGYVAGYRRDGEPSLPAIDKPVLDAIAIDPARESAFAAEILALPSEEIEPVFVIPGKDFTRKRLRDGVDLYYAANPLNDLFSLEISVDVGKLAASRLAMAGRLLDKSGAGGLSSEELKKEWYRLGTEFSFSPGDHSTAISISGLDENFAPSIDLMMSALLQPTAPDSTLEELIEILLVERQDAVKDHNTVHRALFGFNRHGDNSSYLRVLSNEQLQHLTVGELHAMAGNLLSHEHDVSYTGSLPMDQVVETLLERYVLPAAELRAPPPFEALEIRRPAETEILFFDKEMAQALVRIESGGETYGEDRRPQIDLFNEYFYGGMAGIVFQELREARGLAYSAWAWQFHGDRKEAYDLFSGFIGSQADKAPEAVGAFIALIDDIPESEERFAAARKALVEQYRTRRLGFRDVLGAVRRWERQEVPVDPRAWRFEQVRIASLRQLLDYHAGHIEGRPKMISIVGDGSKIDLDELRRFGEVVEVGVEDIFGY